MYIKAYITIIGINHFYVWLLKGEFYVAKTSLSILLDPEKSKYRLRKNGNLEIVCLLRLCFDFTYQHPTNNCSIWVNYNNSLNSLTWIVQPSKGMTSLLKRENTNCFPDFPRARSLELTQTGWAMVKEWKTDPQPQQLVAFLWHGCWCCSFLGF